MNCVNIFVILLTKKETGLSYTHLRKTDSATCSNKSVINKHSMIDKQGVVSLSGRILHNEMESSETLFTSQFKYVPISSLTGTD